MRCFLEPEHDGDHPLYVEALDDKGFFDGEGRRRHSSCLS